MNGDCFSRERVNLRITVILSGGLSEPYRLAFRASYWRYTLGSKHPVKLVIKTSLTTVSPFDDFPKCQRSLTCNYGTLVTIATANWRNYRRPIKSECAVYSFN